MSLPVFVLAFVTFVSTLVGGAFALRFKKVLPYFFAFAAGSLLGVVFLDILPESISLAEAVQLPTRYVMMTAVFSLLAYSLLEKYFLTHHHEHDEKHGHIMGPVGASSLAVHSFFDGVAIGAAFQVNPAIGTIVALAVISHDFTDGINTVTLMLKNRHDAKSATKFLVADALAPALGIALTSFVAIPEYALALILAVFTGEFLYIGAANLLPETIKHPDWRLLAATAVGVLLILGLTTVV